METKWVKTENGSLFIEFLNKQKPYRIQIQKQDDVDIVTNFYHNWNGSSHTCDFCKKDHGYLCEGILTHYEEIRDVIKKALHSPGVRLNLIFETNLDFDNVYIGIQAASLTSGRFIDAKIARTQLSQLAKYALKEKHVLTELSDDLACYTTTIKKSAEENIPGKLLIYIADINKRNYLHYTSVECVEIIEARLVKKVLLYKDIRSKNRISAKALNSFILDYLKALGVQFEEFNDEEREIKWRVKLLDTLYEKIPTWRKTEEILKFERDFYEKTAEFKFLLSYLEPEAYFDIDTLEQELTDYYYVESAIEDE